MLYLILSLYFVGAAFGVLQCKPPDVLPQCVTCSDCRKPGRLPTSLHATIDNTTSRFFSDGDGDKAHRFVAMHGLGTKTHLEFKVTPDAPDVYRFFTVVVAYKGRKLSVGEGYGLDVLLDGNMKGNGNGCQMDVDSPILDVNDGADYTELNPVPADRCY